MGRGRWSTHPPCAPAGLPRRGRGCARAAGPREDRPPAGTCAPGSGCLARHAPSVLGRLGWSRSRELVRSGVATQCTGRAGGWCASGASCGRREPMWRPTGSPRAAKYRVAGRRGRANTHPALGADSAGRESCPAGSTMALAAAMRWERRTRNLRARCQTSKDPVVGAASWPPRLPTLGANGSLWALLPAPRLLSG